MKNEAISVVVPCYNEEKTIQKNLARIFNYLKDHWEVFEIIVVNDGSSDGTLKEVKKIQEDLHLRIIDNRINRGKGKVVKQGILESSCELVMFLDADLGIPIEELQKFVSEFENGCDIVIASRFVPGLRIVRPVPWHRQIMEKIFRLLRMAITNNWNVKDTQCGFKVFRRKAAMDIFPRVTVGRFAFDAEVIFIAGKLKYRIKELPISLQNPPNSHVRLFRDPLNMTLDLLRIKANDWRGKYK
ncbi:MAG: glycosyltransferase family 2 protein [Candidatus Moranbacteria bacterium]|nr:glycosyltransferase family 2 protein [Candidatus Moranbacteria bacterium]